MEDAAAKMIVHSSPYLCLFYPVTAGLQGASLGSDEEEIVLIAYIIVDPDINKVVNVQQYVVKPRTADINENILSEQCLSETKLTEAAVKAAEPLETVLAKFESYVRTYVQGGDRPRGMVFVTDGQLPLRQCLHPEACSKNIQLAEFYESFYDLRKEISSFYHSNEEMHSIKEMVKYLCILPNPDLDQIEFQVEDVRDMLSLVLRLIADGHKFSQLEVITVRLEPGICSKNEEVDSNCVVRARGLPWQSSDQDIAKFFRGLNVAKGGVALCLSPQGRRNGEALVRFVSQEHRDMAMKRHKHHINNRYIEVYKASGDDFVNVAGGSNNEAQAFLSKGGQVIIRMRGLPYDCTARQVLEFFDSGNSPCSVLDGEEGVLFVKKPDGRATGDAFVLFAQEDDATAALSKHRELIGTRYIELFRSTTAEVQQVLNRSMDPKTYEQQQPLIAQIPQVPLLPQHIITSGTRKDCIRLRGLLYEALVEHILEFLGEHAKNIVFQGVHMVYNAQGQPSGEAFIQMDSEQSAFLAAQQRHNRYMVFGKKQRYIEVFQCSGEDMNLVLTGGIPAQKVLTSPGMSPTGAWDATTMLPLRLPEAPAPAWPVSSPASPPMVPQRAPPAALMQAATFPQQMLLLNPRLAFAAHFQQQQQHQAAVAAAQAQAQAQAVALQRFKNMQMLQNVQNAAAIKRSWEQAFPAGAAAVPAPIKRPSPYPQPAYSAPPPPANAAASVAAPVMYQQGPQFYPSL